MNCYRKEKEPRVISGFGRDVDEICALVGCYAVWSGNSVLKRRYGVTTSRCVTSHNSADLTSNRDENKSGTCQSCSVLESLVTHRSAAYVWYIVHGTLLGHSKYNC